MRNYSNERIEGTLDVLGKSYASANSLLALGAVTGDASTLTGGTTPSGSPMTAVGDKLDLYNGQYGFGLQASRVVCYVPSGTGFAVRANAASGARSSGTDAVSLLANGNVNAAGTIAGSAVSATSNVAAPILSQTGAATYLGLNGYQRDSLLPLGLGAKMSHDKTRFKTPTLVEVSAASDNTGWTTSGAYTAAQIRDVLLTGRTDAGTVALTVALPGLRITGTGLAAAYIHHVLVGFGYQPGTALRVIYETSIDGSSWTSRADASTADGSVRWFALPTTDPGTGDYWRVTLLATTIPGTINIRSLQVLSSRPGDQGTGEQTDLPYSWDGSKVVYAANRFRAGFVAATATNSPLTTSAAEFELTSQSIVTIGEATAGDANPAITMYRTASGTRSGRAFRQRLSSSLGPFITEWGGSNSAYGAETYTEASRVDTSGNLTQAGFVVAGGLLTAYNGLTNQMRLVGSTAAAAPTSGTWMVGDTVIARSDGRMYTCIVAGTPGTWVHVGAPAVAAATKTLTAVNAPAPFASEYLFTATLDKSGYLLRPPGAPGYVQNTSGRLSYAAASITGDLDVRYKAAMADWTPSAAQIFAAKTDGSTTTAWGWAFYISSTGTLALIVTPDGQFASRTTYVSSASVPFTDGNTGWVRVTYDADNGSGNAAVTFYTSTDGSSWTQLGVGRTGPVGNIYDNAAVPYTLGAYSNLNANNMVGDILYAEIRNGIGGTNVVPTDPSSWTLQGGTAVLWTPGTPLAGTKIRLGLTQDGTGSRTVTWPSNVKWPGGTAPTISTAAGAQDYLELDCVDGTNWLGRTLGLAYA